MTSPSPSPQSWAQSVAWLRAHRSEHELFQAAAAAGAIDVLDLLLETRPVLIDSVGRAESTGSHQEEPLLDQALGQKDDRLLHWLLSKGCPRPLRLGSWWERMMTSPHSPRATLSTPQLLARIDALRASGLEQQVGEKSAIEIFAEKNHHEVVEHLLGVDTDPIHRANAMEGWKRGLRNWWWLHTQEQHDSWQNDDRDYEWELDTATLARWERMGAILGAAGIPWPTDRDFPDGTLARVKALSTRLMLENGLTVPGPENIKARPRV